MRLLLKISLFFYMIFHISCSILPDNKVRPLFEKVNSEKSHIYFKNIIEETPELNVIDYEYLYNGGGIAAGDFNNDGLCDLFFTGNAVNNVLYLNRGKMVFSDVTVKAKLIGRPKWKTGVAVADVNGDGWLDLYVCYSGPMSKEERTNQLFINKGVGKDGIPTFTECAAEYGLDAVGTYSTHASFFDYDNDGDLDMFLLNHGDKFYAPFFNTKNLRTKRHPYFGNRLYQNEGGIFKDVSEAAGIAGGGLNFGLSVSVGDLNSDGWADIYVTNDYEEQDFLYINNRDGTFKESSNESMGHISRYGMGSDIADFNNDSRLDIIVADMLPESNHRQKMLKGPDEYYKYQLMVDSGYHHQNMRNTLQLNQGNNPGDIPIFSEIGQLSNISNTDWSWATLFADFDNDGLKDLFVSNGYLRDYTNMDFLKYTFEKAIEENRRERKDIKVLDLIGKIPSTKVSNYVFKNNEDFTFSDKSIEWGIYEPSMSFGAVYADLDNDGDLDLVINNTNEPAVIWQNTADKTTRHNYLKIKLKGISKNRNAIGAKVYLTTESGTQYQELMLSRGYQSSIEPVLHFGLGKSSIVKELRVVWPDGRISTIQDIVSNQMLEVNHNQVEAVSQEKRFAELKTPTIFFEATLDEDDLFTHKENTFVDFYYERLIPYQLSRLGPHLCVGDVNGDQLDDFFIGGASGQSGKLFLMKHNGNFVAPSNQPWGKDSLSEDIGSVFFDADGDGDLDLYVVSGGNEFKEGSAQYKDRLYLNKGDGSFENAPLGSIPTEYASGSCVIASDFDKDGDLDLFVGGRTQPRSYPTSTPSKILRNDTKDKTIKFIDVSKEVLPELKNVMVTDAIWTDYNDDQWIDLLVVGEWTPIMLFENRYGKFRLIENETLQNTFGFWEKIIAEDFDDDGDLDYVIGNVGTNLQWKASTEEPLLLYFDDFDGNGTIDPLICSFIGGTSYPIATRDELLEQIPMLRKKFVRYENYAGAKIEDVIGVEQIKKATKLKVTTLESSYVENLSGGEFLIKPLPIESQFSMVNALLADDYDLDGHKDLLLAGNFYPYKVQYGKSDASFGLFLKGNGKGEFSPVHWQKSGFYSNGDVRDMKSLHFGGDNMILIGKNDEKMKLIKYKRPSLNNE